MKTVLTIAGSDCSGGAGIQADLKTFAAHGVFGMSAIVSVVAENTSRVLDVMDVTPEMIGKQLDAVFEDMPVDAVKLGMLSTPDCMEKVAERLRRYGASPIVADPVMFAKNGCPLMRPEAVEAYSKTILPLADVLTPNLPEAERLSGMAIRDVEDMRAAARRIRAQGCRCVLIKGGHAQGDALDLLDDGKQVTMLSAPRVETCNTHGTGCTLSSALAANLALGLPLEAAARRAKAFVTLAIAHGLPLGKGYGPTDPFYALYRLGLSGALEALDEEAVQCWT